jgi:signal transduction histidine kinase
MDLFVTDAQFRQWQTQLLATPRDLNLLLQLAWHARERDGQAALQWAASAEGLLPADGMVRREVQARLALVRGEILFFGCEYDAALGQVAQMVQILALPPQPVPPASPTSPTSPTSPASPASQTLPVQPVQHTSAPAAPEPQPQTVVPTAADWIMVDGHLLSIAIRTARGQHAERLAHLQQARQQLLAMQAGQSERMRFCDCLQAVLDIFRDGPQAQAQWSERLALDQPGLTPGALAHIHYFHASALAWGNDCAQAISHWIAAFDGMYATGQMRWAILALSNTGATFNALNEHHAALEWMERALELAERMGWRASIALCLSQVGETLRLQGQPQRASDYLARAHGLFDGMGNSRNFVLNLSYLGELALDLQHYPQAMDYFIRLQQAADRMQQIDFQAQARRGQARALLALGRFDAALPMAQSALVLSQKIEDVPGQIADLRVLAQTHRALATARPTAAANPATLATAAASGHSACLDYLLQAYRAAQTLREYQIVAGLPDELAREYARLGQFEQAHAIMQQANLARDRNHRLDGTRSTIALRIAWQTAEARASSEHHRQLAHSAAHLSASLSHSNQTLRRLSQIGLQITAQLDLQQVLQALAEQAAGLLPVDSLLIFLLDPDSLQLHLALGLEQGQPFHMAPIEASDAQADSVRAWQERRVIVRDYDQFERGWNQIEGTTHTVRSALFAPLTLAQRVLGVMSLQSFERHAFDEQQQLIFGTLCAYGAIALDNALTYRRVQNTQAQLVEQQKLVSLGSLVAGVAQQLQQPLADCLAQVQQLQQIHAPLAGASDKADLLAELGRFGQIADQVNADLTVAAGLVRNFKQVAVDRHTLELRDFELAALCGEVMQLMLPLCQAGQHRITIDVPAELHLHGYPATLAQVLENLMRNALAHAFPERSAGQLHLSARMQEGARVRLVLQDDGVGIAADDLPRIFTPLAHTRLAQGRHGLGLPVSYNLVTALLQGKIAIDSKPGQGTTVTLDLPLLIYPCHPRSG